MLQSVISNLNLNTIHQCDICPMAKLHKLPYVSSKIKSSAPFDLIHADIWSPFSTIAIDGSKYFLTLVDDFTRCVWTYLLNSKSQTQSVIPAFFTLVETQFNLKIKCIRSGNGSEFHLRDLSTSKGVIHQKTCVESPQQNGVVERKHHHLLNVARAIHFQANLPLSF